MLYSSCLEKDWTAEEFDPAALEEIDWQMPFYSTQGDGVPQFVSSCLSAVCREQPFRGLGRLTGMHHSDKDTSHGIAKTLPEMY
jgi:hypothetical protein